MILDKPREGFLNWKDLLSSLKPVSMSSFIEYLKDTRAELRHVAWPTQTQTVVFTTLVVAVSIFVSAYLGVFDYIFTSVLQRVVTGGAAETFVPPTDTTVSTS